MICKRCGVELSDKVYVIHRDRCKGDTRATSEVTQAPQPESDNDELRKDELIERAREAGLRVDRRYSVERIEEMLQDVNDSQD